MSDQSTLSEVWYACVESERGQIWTCQGPYNTVQLADDFLKERLNAHTTMLVNTPTYLPLFIRERSVRSYILEQRQPKILFTKPEGEGPATAIAVTTSLKPPVEWAAH